MSDGLKLVQVTDSKKGIFEFHCGEDVADCDASILR
jgi:hypothetical protein